jgi:TolB-like protein/cytochrome c-type biogenesis protein CcmH/NrfG
LIWASVGQRSRKSVAVLPFADMSEKKDQEYFSDGLSEELIDMLTKVPDLRVPARTSSFYFKGKQNKIPDIARELSVANVLEGSVRKSGNFIRITAQLVRADTGYHLWSKTYDRKLEDIFKIQDEIADAVVQALKVSLLTDAMPKTKGTQNDNAYTLYLQARYVMLRLATKEDARTVIDYAQQALKLDPKFALAWALLSRAHQAAAAFDLEPYLEGVEEARRAASQALALDPSLPEAHTAMATILRAFDFDWAGANAHIKLALQTNPEDAHALSLAAQGEVQLAHFDEAITILERSMANDPLNPRRHLWLGVALYGAGRISEAQVAIRKALDLNPLVPEGHRSLGDLVLASGDPAAAILEYARGSDYESQYGRALAYHAMKRKEESDSALSYVEERYGDTRAYGIADIHAFRGEFDQVFTWLNRAYLQRDGELWWIKGDPLLNNLHSDPRYKAFLRKMDLPE